MGLLGGQYYNPDEQGGNLPQRAAQRLFLRCVAVKVPAVLEALEANVLPHYAASFARNDRPRWAGPVVASADAPRLERELVRWAERFHLTEPWAVTAALATMRLWSRQKKISPRFVTYVGSAPENPFPLFRYEGPGWLVRWQTRTEAEEAIKNDVTAALKGYLDKVEEQARAAGWETTPRKLDTKRREAGSATHFGWLARYQCGGEKQTDIAAGANVSAPSVSDAIRSTAALVGLRLREGRAAPRKQKQRNKAK